MTPSLQKNNTSYQIQAINILKTVHDHYLEDRNFDAPWSGMLKYHQYIVRRIMTDPEFNLGGENGRGLLIYHQMGMGKTRLAVAIALSLWDTFEPLILLPKSLQANFEKTLMTVLRILNHRKSPEELSRIQKNALMRFKFLSTNANNIGDKLLKTSLRKRIIIVDEAHNLFRSIINGGKNAMKVYSSIMSAKDVRIVFLTGTPCSKDPFEIVPCFNMLMGYDILPVRYDHFNEYFVNKHANTIKNKHILANRLFGLVSYASMEVDRKVYLEHFADVYPIKVENCEMTSGQYRTYLLARQREREEVAESEHRDRAALPPMVLPSSDASFGTYYVRSRMISNLGEGPSKSPKFIKILENIAQSPGPVVVYSQFVKDGGLGSFSEFLKENGYTHIDSSPGPKTFGVYSGDVSPEVRRKMVALFNDPRNIHGDFFKIFMISEAGAEGVSLHCVRQVHIMEPYWDDDRTDQVIYRGVRLEGHHSLPLEERNVQPFMYLATANKNVYDDMSKKDREPHTTDELFYTRAKKKKVLNNEMRKILQSVSFECQHLNLSHCRVCKPTDERLYTKDIRKDLRNIDPCKKMEEQEVEVSKIVKDGTEYYYRKSTENQLGYDFYTFSEAIQSLVSIDPGDPIIEDILEEIEPFKF